MLEILKLAQQFSTGNLDLKAAADALGLNPQILTRRDEYLNAITLLANACQSAESGKAEVVFIAGSPAIMKGKSVRIVAVFGDIPTF